jgi:hypothetical protein
VSKLAELLDAFYKKGNPESYGKDPIFPAVTRLHAACLKEGEKVSQAPIAVAGDASILTSRKKFQDVRCTLQ